MKRRGTKEGGFVQHYLTGNQGSLRQHNLSSVLQLIYNDRPVSRVELSRITGLNKATVSSLVATLVESRCVRFIGENKPERAGRREIMIDIDPGKASIVSAEVGVGFISAITTNFAGEIVWRRQVEIEKEILPDGVTTRVVRLVRKAAAEGEQRVGPLAGVSVAVPGAVDVESGTVLFAPNLGWREYPFYERLKTKFGVPVFIDNEASFAALGEHFFGSAKGYNEVLYISIGVGIGGGIITAGDLYRGAGGIAGEFGHMTVDIKGSKCACGKTGCWETVASEAALLREVQRETVVESKGSMLHRSDMEMLTALLESARAGDTRTLDALKVICKNLAVGIDSLIKAFNPERVVLGGPLSVLHEFMVPMIDLELQKRPIFDLSHSTEIVSASFGADASMMGGVAIIVRSILSNPTR